MFTITVQHMSYVQLQRTLQYHPLAIEEDSLPDSKLVLAESRKDVSDFRLTLYKWSDDSDLRDEQQLLYLTLVNHNRSSCFQPGLDCVQVLVD
ncbi:hypothetical protein TNCV_2626431 [Trichonephila clavipes]|uniref:Uncharacterized protein n=1 Tax=Trichonephila clavipes TaxID=2585209 RepID=A0A8X6W7J5_TRICX|nr:hypothetical protein TNCV_2626431 [Trichonephila clavipes]